MPETSVVSAEVYRGDHLESLHRATAVACRTDGSVLFALGDPERPIFPRSAFKPFQALALMELGGADRFGLTEREIALACSSHSGEPGHTAAVKAWLGRMGLGIDDLACGPQIPFDAPVSKALFLSGQEETRAHHNCSGKHCGMLATCLTKGWPTDTYCDLDHPLQRWIHDAAKAVTGWPDMDRPEYDGCGAPTMHLPIRRYARALACLADPSGEPPRRRAALERIGAAMRAHPWWVSGSDRSCADYIRACPDVIAKMGSEGVYGIAIGSLGIGIAIKSDDGAERGSQVAAAGVLEALSVVDPDHAEAVRRWGRPILRNSLGDQVGRIAPSATWLDGCRP